MNKASINRRVTRLLAYMRRRAQVDIRRGRTMELVWEMAAQDSAEYISTHFDDAVLFDDRNQLWTHALKAMPKTGLVMECGVFQGVSINFIARWMKQQQDPREVHGFDSFEGLQEDWSGEALPKGFFDLKGRLPDVEDSVRLNKGWVQDTVEPFLERHPNEGIALLHIDTDTYTPARYLLELLKDRFVDGAIVVFDELVGYPNWREHEYRALIETMSESDYKHIAFTSRQVAIRIERPAV